MTFSYCNIFDTQISQEDESQICFITSLCPVIFYYYSAPETAPYIKKEDFAEKGKVIDMIEITKIFISIKALKSGFVADYLVEQE